ncbi:LysR family transcriptional regulator [Paenibacillus sp. P96]|uniref:LysR family transcriptional regulator n=1 Tax=Paenibacillus zeirhizosphaerae TaxID=2987519 RepID=A0ABT9FKS0_9BACL|nr:LysR family transcriptional regulator [Paenibacillus sp. P96]MDP4095326.1 LysR family transcriptional regulator [Paenibacillus sp. P96]
MTNTQLQLFVKIAETGSFTKAGQALNMTQPAVSRAVSTLEDELDVKLIIRDRRNGIVLTDVGSRILVLFREILNGFEKVEQEIAAEKGLEVGVIRIGTFTSASAHFLPRIIRTIGEKYPNLQFDLHEGTIDEIHRWLESRQIDIGFTIMKDHQFERIPLLREEMFAVIRDDHPLTSRSAIRIEELAQGPMIICKGGFETPIYELFAQADTPLKPKFVVSSLTTLLNMIQEGLGSAIMSGMMQAYQPPNVTTRRIEPRAYRDIHMVLPSLQEAPLAVKLFIRTTLELFGPEESRL